MSSTHLQIRKTYGYLPKLVGKINLHCQKKYSFVNFCQSNMFSSYLLVQDTDLSPHLSVGRQGLNPSDQTEIFIYSGQKHFKNNVEGNFTSSCAEPTKTLTTIRQRCHFMNIQTENLKDPSSKGHLYPATFLVAPAACTSHQGFLWAPSHGLLPFTALGMNWFGSVCSALTFRLKMYSWLWTCSLDQHCPANELDFSSLVFSFAFSQLTSPTFSLLSGLSFIWQLLKQQKKKRASITNCCLSSSLWFPKTSCSGFRHSHINSSQHSSWSLHTPTNPQHPHTAACHVPP